MFVKNLFPQVMYQADNGAGGGEGNTDNQGEGNTNQNGEGNTSQNQSTENGEGTNNQQNQNQNEHMIPKSRFDEVNTKYKEIAQKLEEIETNKKNEEVEARKKQGEFEELYNETNSKLEEQNKNYEKASTRVEELEGIIQGLLENELDGVDEDMLDLIPDGMTVEQKLKWIGNAKSKGLFGTKTNPKENQELGQETNQQQDADVDVSKMSIGELFKSAYGRK